MTGPLADLFDEGAALAAPSPWEDLGVGPDALAEHRAAIDACVGPVVQVEPFKGVLNARRDAPLWQQGDRAHLRRLAFPIRPLQDPALVNERGCAEACDYPVTGHHVWLGGPCLCGVLRNQPPGR